MATQKLRGKDLDSIGFVTSKSKSMALAAVQKHYKHHSKGEKLSLLKDVLLNADKYTDHEVFQKLSEEFLLLPEEEIKAEIELRNENVEYQMYGKQYISDSAKSQMDNAMRLPISVKGALMPDAHHGYGLPIGGVLASKNSVIPYGVGVDIGCRMSLTLYDVRPNYLDRYEYQLSEGLKANTRFGTGEGFDEYQEDDLFDRQEFREIPFLAPLLNKARKQIGSSGSGNHFVEYGKVVLESGNNLGVEAGEYVGVLAHSGSRGLGANIARHYTEIAQQQCLLPQEVKHLAWLDLNTDVGSEYWLAMNLAGDYAKACHDHIHRRLAKVLGAKPILKVENHHNFAWKEMIDGAELIVHRKGATPAHTGELGIIPGSMATPGYIVSGKGNEHSLFSASHGAGRELSRTKARNSLTRSELDKLLKKERIKLIGGGIDEAPMAYKNIDDVLNAQKNLVNVEGKFYPRIVRMDKC